MEIRETVICSNNRIKELVFNGRPGKHDKPILKCWKPFMGFGGMSCRRSFCFYDNEVDLGEFAQMAESFYARF